MIEPPFFNRRRNVGRRSEERAARRTGASRHPGSGALDGLKGDLSLDDFKIESKSTAGKSLSVRLDWLEKIDREAREVGRRPALLLQFTDDLGRLRRGGSWVAVPEWLWLEVVGED